MTCKDFELLHQFKLKNEMTLNDITNQYFFCIDNRMLFIKKSRRVFKLMASCQCGFEPIYRESCLDVLAQDTEIDRIINLFYGYVLRLVEIIK